MTSGNEGNLPASDGNPVTRHPSPVTALARIEVDGGTAEVSGERRGRPRRHVAQGNRLRTRDGGFARIPPPGVMKLGVRGRATAFPLGQKQRERD